MEVGSDDIRSFTGKDYDASGLIYFNARYYGQSPYRGPRRKIEAAVGTVFSSAAIESEELRACS